MTEGFWLPPVLGGEQVGPWPMLESVTFSNHRPSRDRRPAPLGARRPRVQISHHTITRALHIAAWGSHTCRPFPMRTGGDTSAQSPAPPAE